MHRVCCFSANLADGRLRANAALRAFLARLNGATTLLTATSYMLHHEDFRLVREAVLRAAMRSYRMPPAFPSVT
jgi:hypothetical protein